MIHRCLRRRHGGSSVWMRVSNYRSRSGQTALKGTREVKLAVAQIAGDLGFDVRAKSSSSSGGMRWRRREREVPLPKGDTIRSQSGNSDQSSLGLNRLPKTQVQEALSCVCLVVLAVGS